MLTEVAVDDWFDEPNLSDWFPLEKMRMILELLRIRLGGLVCVKRRCLNE